MTNSDDKSCLLWPEGSDDSFGLHLDQSGSSERSVDTVLSVELPLTTTNTPTDTHTRTHTHTHAPTSRLVVPHLLKSSNARQPLYYYSPPSLSLLLITHTGVSLVLSFFFFLC